MKARDATHPTQIKVTATAIMHPSPQIWTAKRASDPRKCVGWIQQNLGATTFVETVNFFLQLQFPNRSSLRVSEHDLFDIWTRMRLFHERDPLRVIETKVIETVRASPSKTDSFGRVRTAGVFDTVLVTQDPKAMGLQSKH